MRTDYSIKLLDNESRFLNGRMIENILRYANVDKLKERIRKFQNMDIQKMSDKELEENIIKVLSIKTDEDVMIETILLEYSLFSIGQRFYRVRKLRNTDMPNKDLKMFLLIGIRQKNM